MIREYPAVVLDTVDGDTIDVEIDPGFDLTLRKRVRLEGINCPERGDEKWKEATMFTADWIAKRGGKVRLRTVKDKREKYGRYLAYGWDMEAGECLNQLLIEAGLAVPYARTA